MIKEGHFSYIELANMKLNEITFWAEQLNTFIEIQNEAING